MNPNMILLVAIFIGTSASTLAQSPAELMQLARDNNRELRALHREYEAALEVIPQVNQLPDPEVGVGAFLAPVETRLGAQRARLSATQMFPWFGTLAAREAVANSQAQALYERIASTEFELAYQLKTAYYQLYEIRGRQRINDRHLRLLQSLRQLALSKLESGRGAAAEVLRVDLRIRSLEQEVIILENEATKPQTTINQLLFRPLEVPVTVPDTLDFAPLPFAKDTLLEHVRQYHPTIRMYQLQQASAQRSIELNELERKPSFNVGLDYIMVADRTDATPEHNGRDILQLRAGVRIPLFPERYNAREREQQLRIQALEDRKATVESEILAMIEKAYTDHASAALRQTLFLQQINTTRAIIQLVQAAYSTSGGQFEELLRLEDELVEYDLQLLRANVQSHLAKAGIERYLLR